MAYQVLARKWRPRNFPELVGQTHVVRALTNALEHQRLHHAYLFTGTRGVGKTTIARILARSLNCHQGVTAYPCGECRTCREIDEGRFVDLIEVDAASRTKVEDTRELLENVQYAPTSGRYKVYLIDEVHMLSNHSFNALLKTLEEPPSHVKFLLATTDPQKLPATILSRCLQFSLKRLPVELISQHLSKILEAEGIEYEVPALQALAQSADGSLRDALSLLDQAIAYGGGKLTSDDVHSMLGTLDHNTVLELMEALVTRDAPLLLAQIARLAEHNPDFMTVLGEVLSLLQRIAIAQVLPNPINPVDEAISNLAQRLAPEDIQLFYQIGLLGRRDLPFAPDPRGGFEMVMLRMIAFYPEVSTQPQQSRPLSPSAPQRIAAAPVVSNPVSEPIPSASPHNPVPPREPSAIAASDDEWGQIVQRLPLKGLVQQLATHCEFKKRDRDILHLALSPQHSSLRIRVSELEKILQEHYDPALRLDVRVSYPEGNTPAALQRRIQETRQETVVIAVEMDPFIVQMKEIFEAQIKGVTVLPSNPSC